MRGSKNNNSNNPSSPDRYSNNNNNNNGVTAASTTQNYPHSPHTPGSVAGSTFFNDAMTVDSWNTTMTAMLQPHKNQKNTFQCPTHLSFTTKDPLDACPHCERQQQLTLQERRRSVEQQLRDMDQQAKGGTSGASGAVANNNSNNKKGSSSSSTNNVAKDILQDLQSTVQQWKQQPVAATTTVPSNATPQQPTHTATPTPSTPGTTTSGNDQSHATDLTGATHAADNTQTNPTTGAPMLQSPPAVGNTAATATGPPQPPPVMTMPPPMPPMVPSFGTTPPPPPGAAPTTATASGTPLEALALQIQGMQRMQDWMLYQKEQECQTLRQRLDSATQQINTLAVENALLQEKLNQQEQRMKHELKLIKLAALQQRNGSTKNKNGSSDTSNTGNPMVVTAPRGSGASIASHHSGGSGSANNNNTSSNNNNDSFGFPSNETAQPKTAVITSALSRQEHQSIFHNHTTASASTQPHGNSVGMTPSSPGNPASVQSAGSSSGRDPMGAVSAATGETNPALTMSNSLSMSPEQQKSGDDSDNNIQNNKGPVDLDDITEMINAKKEGGSVRSAAGSGHAEAPPPANNPSDDFSYQNIPRDIQIDPSTSASSSNPASGTKPTTSNKPTAVAAAIQPLPPPPDTSKGSNSQPPPLQAATTPVSGLPAAATVTPSPSSEHNTAAAPPILVNFPDSSDNMSVGNTVASSTYGEDRQQVTSQIILDPYGDRGTYTGVILRSTGMPHGSGRMIYQEDKRTYDGEWRHGRWHGYGRATFANGDNYHGEYRFDQRHGRGRYEWNDGRVYDGMFKEDKRHGRGVFTWPDGAVYEGDFRMGQREGHGTYRFSDGGRYEGSWKDGRYNGFGICNWEDGRCYKGEWLGGMAHGKGVETFADGTVRHDGQWIEDEPVVS